MLPNSLSILLAFILAFSLGSLVDVKDVTERSVNDGKYPDVIELQLDLGNDETETIQVKRNPHHNHVSVESIDRRGVKRNVESNQDVAEYISERAALHVTAERDGDRYRRSVSGLIYRRDMAYLVEPNDREQRQLSFSRHHKIKLLVATGRRHNIEGLIRNDEVMPPPENRTSYRGVRYRQGTELIVDVLAIVDYALYSMLRDQYVAIGGKNDRDIVVNYIKQYYGVIWAGIIQRYHDVNHRGMTITPRLAKMIVATSPEEDHWTDYRKTRDSIDSNPALEALSNWVRSRKRDGEYKYIDHTMLFTGLRMFNLDERGRKSYDVVGVAYTGAICGRYSVSMIEENLSLQSVGTAAHELGHSLGARHDGRPLNPSCRDRDHYLMCPFVTHGNSRTYQNIYTFSRCSMNSFYKVMKKLNSERRNCMADNPAQDAEMRLLSDVLPGHRLDLHAQCKANLGDNKSYYCGPNTQEYMQKKACYRFQCTKYGRCRDSYKHHALHGTPCGGSKWCKNGKCVEADGRWAKVLKEQHGICPVRDPEVCKRKSSSICSKPELAAQCCNKCKTGG